MNTNLKHIDPASIDVDAEGPRTPGPLTADPPKVDQGYRRMRAYDVMTNDPKGWLGCTGNLNLYLYQDSNDPHVAAVKFVDYKDQKWLARDTTPYDRFAGVATQSYATWGLTGGWNDPVIWNADHTVSLDPKYKPEYANRSLYNYDGYCCWSDRDDPNNRNVLRFEFE